MGDSPNQFEVERSVMVRDKYGLAYSLRLRGDEVRIAWARITVQPPAVKIADLRAALDALEADT